MQASVLPSFAVVRTDARGLDAYLVGILLVLLGVGLVAIFSTTIVRADGGLINPYFARQALYASAGCFVAFLIWRYVPVRTLRDYSLLLALLALLALAAATTAGIGIEANGARRWLQLGPINVQPVEFAKPLLLIYACAYCAAHRTTIRTFSTLLPLLGVLGIACVLLLLQPDLGSAVLLTMTAAIVVFLAGARWLHLLMLASVGLAALAAALLAAPYRVKRLIAFVDPFAHAQGGGYQQVQSLMAFGNGGWTGKGLGLSVGKWAHLPEAHTDFIASVLAEELGLVSIIMILALFAAIMIIGFETAVQAERRGDFFASLLARSIAVMLVLQVFINLGGNLSLLPVKGITLPLLSYGGSSLVAWLLTLVLLLLIRRDNVMHGSLQTKRR